MSDINGPLFVTLTSRDGVPLTVNTERIDWFMQDLEEGGGSRVCIDGSVETVKEKPDQIGERLSKLRELRGERFSLHIAKALTLAGEELVSVWAEHQKEQMKTALEAAKTIIPLISMSRRQPSDTDTPAGVKRRCDTCKYYRVSSNEEPCRNCRATDNWPKWEEKE